MAEQASSAEGDFGSVAERPVGLPGLSLQVSPGASPKGYDLVIGSYDATYSGSGALHQYIARELDLENAERKTLFSGQGHRIQQYHHASWERPILLGQVISIYGSKEQNSMGIQANLATLLRDVNHAYENGPESSPLGVLTPKSIWVPTLGTGSAGLSHPASVEAILEAMVSGMTFAFGPSLGLEITIAPPKTISRADHQEILDLITSRSAQSPAASSKANHEVISEPEAVSEMPDHFHSDHALTDVADDDLGRDAIAETIATNVTRVWDAQRKQNRPFAIHLSGRWGSGKSSILGFLGKKLTADTTIHPQGWVIVNYNAWRMQEAGPPWWSLLTTVREQGYAALGSRGYWPRFTDWAWRTTRVAWPWIATFIVLVTLMILFQFLPESGPTVTITTSETLVDTSDVTSVQRTVTPLETPDNFLGSGNAWTFVLAIITGLGSLGAMAKLIQGWNRTASETAEAVRELQSDPTAAVKARFERVIANIERPVVVFIDDLDRCDAKFVVELMQSLQTAYAHVAVLYVVASDRDWIVSAYNQIYDGFQPELSKPGAPLGYLFVKKIFQLSVPVPDLAQSDRSRLTQALLDTHTVVAEETATREERAHEIRTAAAEGDLSRVTEIQSAALAEGQNLAPEVMRAVSDPANQKRLRHKLLSYADAFDGNPRAIKRLINALTFRQGYILTAAEEIPFDQIARWTILSLRFPYTADLLAARPKTPVPEEPTDAFPDPEAIRFILGSLTPEQIAKVAAFG